MSEIRRARFATLDLSQPCVSACGARAGPAFAGCQVNDDKPYTSTELLQKKVNE
jgi:hypothetical protein